jgi:hypothetical protein
VATSSTPAIVAMAFLLVRISVNNFHIALAPGEVESNRTQA